MMTLRSIRHSSFILSLLWLATVSLPARAEVPLRAFSATYSLYQGGMHVANTELSLQQMDDGWRWQMKTSARGIYALFVNKRPHAETHFIVDNNKFRLQQILVTDSNDQKNQESAQFDWNAGKIRVMRKGNRLELPLTNEVFDHQSIHFLAAAMLWQRQSSKSVDFYRKGRLSKSLFHFSGKGKVKLEDKSHEVNIFEQLIVRSNARLKYYYDAANPMLPLRIEKLESGESPTVMNLTRVDWVL